MSNVATGRKKSNLKKYMEESQLRVAGWFRGRGGRGCRAAPDAAAGPVLGQALSLLGAGDLAGWMPRCERQQTAMAIMQGGDGAVQCSEARWPCRQETLLVGGVLHLVAVVPDDAVDMSGNNRRWRSGR